MKAYTKDIVQTIRKGKKRFVAIMIICALGVCMLTGLKASCVDLRYSADKFFDEQNLFDISIVSTMGLTEEDIEVLSQLEMVEAVEGAYSETVFTVVDGKTKQVAVNVLSEKGINVPYLLDGEMPLCEDEILVTQKYLSETGKELGDTIVIEEDMEVDKSENEENSNDGKFQQSESVIENDKTSESEENNLENTTDQDEIADDKQNWNRDKSKTDNEDTTNEQNISDSETDKDNAENADTNDTDLEITIEEEEEEPNFLYTTYKIVGVVTDITDINSNDGAVSFRNNSTTDYTFFVMPEAVSTEIYTAVYMTLYDCDELLCYSDAYEEKVDTVVQILESEIKADREKARYDEVTGDAIAKIEDAENQMNDKFADVEAEIADAKVEISDGWSDLFNGEEDLLDGEEDIEEAQRKLAKAQRELERAERELDDAEKQIEEGLKELESGQLLLQVSEVAVEQLENMVKISEETLNESEKSLEELETNISKQFEPMRGVLEGQIFSTETDIEEIKEEITVLEEEIKQLETEIAQLQEKETQEIISEEEQLQLIRKQSNLDTKKRNLSRKQNQLETLQSQFSKYNDSLNDLDAQEQDAYKDIKKGREELEKKRAELEADKQELTNAKAELEANKKQLEEGRIELEKGQQELEAGKKQIADGWEELEKGWDELEEAYGKIKDGWNELKDGKQQLTDGEAELEANVQEYEEKKQEALDLIADARQEIADLKMTEWYISTRISLSGYSNVQTDAGCIEAIGDAFPIIFLTIAILISLTTISRMVEEDRGLIGTYKALGFTDKEIRRKYVIYAVLACLFGGILGDLLGFVVLPNIIFYIFGVMYQLPSYVLKFDFLYGVGGVILFIVGIVGASIVSCEAELSHMPAMLMRPKAPKNGSRVFLEKVTPVWSRLSFLNKVTARNLFRYKKRLFMTLFGIAGCTALLLCGYTIKDTVTTLMPLQYEQTYTYDVMVVAEDNKKLLEYLEEDTSIRKYINTLITNVKLINEEGKEETIQMIVLPEGENFRGFIQLYDENGEKLTLNKEDVFATINVSKVLGFENGDSITLQTLQLDLEEIEITKIVMNYLGNSVYMTQAKYEELFGTFKPNAALILLNGENQESFVEELAEQDGIISAVGTESLKDGFEPAFRIINLVVYIVIILAAALAFVVLFTLATTNISERERELATIKVLGFYDKEVHSYVNKETLILTSLGIIMGLPIGNLLGAWLMSILNMPSIYFKSTLYPISYLISAVIAISFAFIVNFITDRSLDVIDPVEALKSIE